MGALKKSVIELQYASIASGLPSRAKFCRWAEAALAGRSEGTELVIRVVDEVEMTALNRRYRGSNRPTNVLSFPFEAPPPIETDLIGDLVICAPVVEREAEEQGKGLEAHWAHLVVHGVLHLLGYDHTGANDTEEMENLERSVLHALGFPDPYTDIR